MQPEIIIRFIEDRSLDELSIRLVRGIVGLYFIYVPEVKIEYPFAPSSLVYIGMSESSQNSIGNRLRDHASGQSGNPGLTNYIKSKGARFTYLTYDFLSLLQIPSVAELEGAFLRLFISKFGCSPICNNQSGIEFRGEVAAIEFGVDWGAFAWQSTEG